MREAVAQSKRRLSCDREREPDFGLLIFIANYWSLGGNFWGLMGFVKKCGKVASETELSFLVAIFCIYETHLQKSYIIV